MVPPGQDSAAAVGEAPGDRRELRDERQKHCLTRAGNDNRTDPNRAVVERFEPGVTHERFVNPARRTVVDPKRENRDRVRFGEGQRDMPQQRLHAAD